MTRNCTTTCRMGMAAILLSTATCAASQPHYPTAGPGHGATWQDECTTLAGYAEFRAALLDAVSRRDAASFRELFSVRGAMRLNGLDLHTDSARWAADDGPWAQLDGIVRLGCRRDGDRLFIPFFALFGETQEQDSAIIAVRATRIFPSVDATPAIGRLARGDIAEVEEPYAASGWMRIRAGGRSGFVRSTDMWSGGDASLELIKENDHWRIVWFGGRD